MKSSLKILPGTILFILVATIVTMSGNVFAQALKFGHVNSAALIQSMPETKRADSTLKKFGESLDLQLKAMTAELQSKYQKYQQQSAPAKMNSRQEGKSLQQQYIFPPEIIFHKRLKSLRPFVSA